jgi:hypothetical protein
MQKHAFNIHLYMHLGKRLGKRLISVLLTGLACHNPKFNLGHGQIWATT